MIIDFLHDDSRALAACCLTCRSWVPASRLHRFRLVRLTPTNSEAFQRILEAAPGIAHYVKLLTVDFQSLESRVSILDAQNAQCPILQQILVQLDQVTSLCIDEITIAPNMLSLFSNISATIKYLHFGVLAIVDVELLNKLICSFHLLETMSITYYTVLGPELEMKEPSSIPPSLRSLNFTFPPREYVYPVVRWLVSQRILLQLQQLSLYTLQSDIVSSATFGLMLKSLGPSLRRLDLRLSRGLTLKGMDFDLAQCTSLHHIKFHASPKRDVHRSPFQPANYFPVWAAAFLKRIKTHSIRSISFSIKLQYSTDLRDLQWIEDIALPLSRPEFKNLRKLSFQIVDGRYEREFRKFIRREIPELHDRGILSIYAVPV